MDILKQTFGILLIATLIFNSQGCNSKSNKQAAGKDTSCCEKETISKSESCCSSNKNEAKDNSLTTTNETSIQAYYFHATRRCATCQAVESVTKEILKEKYTGKVSFITINREKEKDNPLLKKYKINGQSLLLVKGDKVVNLTNIAFMNARSNPEKLKLELATTIESMLD